MTSANPVFSSGRVALITGASSGIGRLTAVGLAQAGYRLFLACRSEERTLPVIADIIARIPGAAAEWLPLELGDPASVRHCASAFLARGLPLHLLVNNAGLAGARGMTPAGFEMMFGVNHMGHFQLTGLLLERLRESAPARVVTVASRAHKRVDGIDWAALRRPTASLTGVREYGVSKLANILFSAELGRRLAGSGVSTFSLHPGVIDTGIWRHTPKMFQALNRFRLAPLEEGARTSLYCALEPALAEGSGLYFSDCAAVLPAPPGRDADLAARLWEWSEKALAALPD